MKPGPTGTTGPQGPTGPTGPKPLFGANSPVPRAPNRLQWLTTTRRGDLDSRRTHPGNSGPSRNAPEQAATGRSAVAHNDNALSRPFFSPQGPTGPQGPTTKGPTGPVGPVEFPSDLSHPGAP